MYNYKQRYVWVVLDSTFGNTLTFGTVLHTRHSARRLAKRLKSYSKETKTKIYKLPILD